MNEDALSLIGIVAAVICIGGPIGLVTWFLIECRNAGRDMDQDRS